MLTMVVRGSHWGLDVCYGDLDGGPAGYPAPSAAPSAVEPRSRPERVEQYEPLVAERVRLLVQRLKEQTWLLDLGLWLKYFG